MKHSIRLNKLIITVINTPYSFPDLNLKAKNCVEKCLIKTEWRKTYKQTPVFVMVSTFQFFMELPVIQHPLVKVVGTTNQ